MSPCLKEQTQMVEEMNKDILIQSRWLTVCAALASNMRKLQTRYQGGKIDSAPVISMLLFKRFLALWGYVVPAFSVSP